jgi:predicted enzyme related to lactoylglutathione lyase
VGHWRTDGHVIGDDPVPIVGTDVYEWLPGRHFLVHHVDVMVGDEHVHAIELIGDHDPATDSFTAQAYDHTGAVTTMRVGVDPAGVWHFAGGADVAAPARATAAADEGAVRSTLTLAADRRSMRALWERAEDGVVWEPWMDVRFTREADPASSPSGPVHQLRLVVEADDFEEATAFYRDTVGLVEEAAFEGDGDARVVIFEAGRATLELANPAQVAMIDRVEVGRRVSPKLRLALEVDDTAAATARLAAAGAAVLADAVETPWRSLNSRLTTPGGLQLTLFQELDAFDVRRQDPASAPARSANGPAGEASPGPRVPVTDLVDPQPNASPERPSPPHPARHASM